jgi:dolichyl-phosphate-mannose--protein O-mannosyl transferase
MACVTSVPPEAVPEADLETAPDVDVAPKSPRWGERFRRLVPTRTVDTRSAIDRLRDAPPADVLRSWLLTIGLTALAFVVRFVGFWFPKGILFDETYYAKDAYTLLKLGYEGSWPENANDQIASGNVDVFTTNASFIVHPQVGKWLIASGEWLFGMNSFGWRFASLVFGSLMVALVVRLARRLSRSTMIGAIAGFLLCVDGLDFVMSRLALLDIFEAFFIVAGVLAVVIDRDYFRHRLARDLETRGLSDYGGGKGPFVFRPWLIAAGVLFGLAMGTKWNAVFVLASFGVLAVVWSITARRLAGARRRSYGALLLDGIPAFFSMVVLSFIVYVATWFSWLRTQGGYDRQWGAQHPDSWQVHLLGKPLASLLYYHKEIWDFHNGDYIKHSTHVYAAHPGGWLINARPIGIDAVNGIQPGVDGCPANSTENCLRVISATGTPTLWWFAALALLVSIAWWVAGRDWRFGVPIVAGMSTYLPWFNYTERSLFFFYAITIIPFTAICLAMVLGLILGKADAGPRRRQGAIVAGVILAIVTLNFAFIYPIITDALLTQSQWLARMWFSSWI